MTRARTAPLAGVALVLFATLAALAPGAAPAGAAVGGSGVRRLLVVSLPMVTWADLPLGRMPHLRALLEQSVVADLSVRGVEPKGTLGDGYVTISAGTRAKGNDRDGSTQTHADGTILVPAFPEIVRQNDHRLFNAHAGILATTLAEAGIARAVIGNAAGGPAGRFATPRGQVADAFAAPDGTTPNGSVGAALLQRDAQSPQGFTIAPDAYVRAFDRAWTGRAAVLVEDSDLVRFDAARADGDARATTAARDRALVRFDAVLGRMLAAVDPARDGVLVMGPAGPHGPAQLTVAALRTPGVDAGLAVSSFTRRPGFVSIVDIGPTILDAFRVDAPTSMEGRAIERGRTGGSFASRHTFLVDSNERAMFRDARIGPVTVAFIGGQVVLTIAAAITFTWLGRRARRAIEVGALALLGVLPATFLAALVPFDRHPVGWYWLFLGGVALAISIVAWLAASRLDVGPLMLCLGAIVLLIVADIVTGARLQLNTVFGYSPTVGGRFAGIGNLAYSQLSAAALLLACLLAYRVGGRRGAIVAGVLLGGVIVVDGLPIWGSDIGGVLSMVPAYGVLISGLMGWRVRVRTILMGLGAALLALVAFTFVDLSRPKDSQTHLGRLVNSTRDGGFHSFWIVIERKLSENLGVLFSSVWSLMVPIVFAGVAYIIWRAPGRLRALHEFVPPMRFGLIALAVLAVLGFGLNDSGISIPGVMLGILTPTLIVLLVRSHAYDDANARSA